MGALMKMPCISSPPAIDDREWTPPRRLPTQPIFDVIKQIDRFLTYMTAADDAIQQVE
jgi:hypothetical protein